MSLRPARVEDLGAVSAIYDHYVLTSTCTYQLEPEPAADRLRWFEAHGPLHPVTVAERDARIVGWGSLSPYHARAGYAATVETSVYVHPDCHRQGIGRALLADLVVRAAALGHHAILAVISADQGPSVALHEAFGFVEVGRFREVGRKFGRWLDVVYLERLLA
ncbi:MAG: N-acetyltransferase [Polyangiaceae bacterium]|nr:N-acetyltransferase [Polyangiaceae bacterium]